VALPSTSGTIALFIAIDAGPELAREAAAGALVGAIAQVVFAAVGLLLQGATWPLIWRT
jgi:hypothetical protein